jgi:DNA replication protein DnaC
MRDLVREILKEYDHKRDRAESQRKERIREVYNVIPRVREIDEAIKNLGLECTKAVLMHSHDSYDEYIHELREEIDTLKLQKADLLKKYKYPDNYLDVQYQCDLCNDTGYIDGQRCSCLKQTLINHLYRISNLGSVLEIENFKTFNINLFSDAKYGNYPVSPRSNMLEIVSICEGFVHNFDVDNGDNLLFYGSTGLGKTFLCNCIAKELLDKGKVVIYMTAFNLFRVLEQYRFGKTDIVKDLDRLDTIMNCDLMIIDDLGTELTNSFTVSELFNIINTRLLERRKSIISTNIAPKDLLATYNQRIFSRISRHYKKLEFFGPDLRWEKL